MGVQEPLVVRVRVGQGPYEWRVAPVPPKVHETQVGHLGWKERRRRRSCVYMCAGRAMESHLLLDKAVSTSDERPPRISPTPS